MPSIARPRFLDRIEAHDLKAVAEQGVFVYAYLRTATGTPYYIGIASVWHRPFGRHSCVVPKDPARIRVLRSGLSWEQACAWERRYIARWGRQDNGTGILRNMTDGGDGAWGCIALRGYQRSADHNAKLAAKRRGRKHSEESRALMSANRKGKHLGPRPESTSQAISAKLKGRVLDENWRKKIGEGHQRRNEARAAAAGMEVEEWKKWIRLQQARAYNERERQAAKAAGMGLRAWKAARKARNQQGATAVA